MLVPRLYSYFRSSAAHRVRIALNLKGIAYETIPIHLLRGGGEQHAASFATLSPAHLVPVFEHDRACLTQSLAIIEYLEETHPAPPLLPSDPADRARARALALTIACDIHPINNLRVQQYLRARLGVDQEAMATWSRHWIERGFAAIEPLLSCHGGLFSYGDEPSIADCCLVPQVFNALRAQCDLGAYPNLRRIYEHCIALEAFRLAAPGAQIDAE